MKPKKVKNLIAAAAQGAGILDNDLYGTELSPKKNNKPGKKHSGAAPMLEDNIAASMQNHTSTDDNPFKVNVLF